MKRFWTALAVSFFAFGLMTGCNDYNNTIQYNTGATITNLSPTGIAAGTPTGTASNCPNTASGQSNPCFTIFVTASFLNGFLPTTVVQWNGKSLPACSATAGTQGCSTYLDSTNISAQVPYSLVAKAGTAYVNTLTPQSGSGKNGLSNSLTFIIYGGPNPFPSITSISPQSAPVCNTSKCADVPITVSGSNFLPSSPNGKSSVTITGPVATANVEIAINISNITETEIKAVIPARFLAAADTTRINVLNPPSGICLVNCPDLGGGDTNCTTPPVPATCVPTSADINTFTIGSPSSSSATTAQAVAEETPAVSQDGRYVAYASMQGGNSQIQLRDTCLGAGKECAASTQTVSVSTEGSVGNGDSHNAAITPDGRYVAFSSEASNLASSAAKGRQVYVRDTCVGAAGQCKPSTVLVSKDEEGKLNGTEGILPSISSTGRYVAFLAVTPSAKGQAETNAHTQAATPNSGLRQVFVRDTCLGAANCTPRTIRISMVPGDGPASSVKPAGPALAGQARQVALSDGTSSTVFTATVPVDERVFLALPKENQ